MSKANYSGTFVPTKPGLAKKCGVIAGHVCAASGWRHAGTNSVVLEAREKCDRVMRRRPLRIAAVQTSTRTLLCGVGTIVVHAYSRRPRWLNPVGVTLGFLLGLLAISNGLLNLGRARPVLARLISGNAQSLNVDYRRVWFLWPSIVHVRNLQVSGSDANVQWQLEVDEARASLELRALLRRELHVTKIQASGIGFRLRQKIDVNAATSDRVAPLPPIPGIEGPPIIAAGPTEPDIPDAQYRLWSVRIENVERPREATLDR